MQINTAYGMDPALFAQAKSKPDINLEKIDETARDFEAMFMSEMLKPMFDSLSVDENFGGGKGEEVFRGFMREEYGKIIAGRGTLGIADMVKEQLIEMQSAAQKAKLAQNMQGNTGVVTEEDKNDVL